jgi:hypothetical protein
VTKSILLASEECFTAVGAAAGGGEAAAVTADGPRAGVCAAGTAAAVSVGSDEVRSGTGAEAGGGTDAA